MAMDYDHEYCRNMVIYNMNSNIGYHYGIYMLCVLDVNSTINIQERINEKH